MIKKASLIGLFSLLCALAGAHATHAASVWDNNIQITNDLTIRSTDRSKTQDIALTYVSIMQDKCPTQYAAFSAALTDPNGRWAITKNVWPSSADDVRIQWTTNTSGTTLFTGTGTPSSVRVNLGSGQVAILLQNNGTFLCNDLTGTVDGFLLLGSTYSGIPETSPETFVLLSTYPVTYPSGYAGVSIPDSWTPPSTEVPNFTGTVVNYNGTFSDYNFFTIDNIPFTCEGDGDGLVPVLHWELWNNDTDVLITSGTQSASSQITYSFNRVNEPVNYALTGWYDCAGEPNFTNATTWEFTIDKNGNMVNEVFEQCLTDEFPFVNLEACIENIFIFTNLLSFGTVTIGEFTTSTSCYNLAIIDDWLNLDNPTICPQFSDTVRNIVTPFVMFILGLITTMFIARESGSRKL